MVHGRVNGFFGGQRNINLNITAGRGRVHGFHHPLNVLLQRGPLRMPDHHDSDCAPFPPVRYRLIGTGVP